MAEDSTQDVVAHATHLLPDLEAVAQQLERNPGAVMRRAFPDTDPASGSRAIVGPGSGLPPLAVDRVGAALSAERKRLLEVGAEALETLRADGPRAALTPEAQLGIEAIVSIARPALMLRDGAFDDAPPPWDHILGPYLERHPDGRHERGADRRAGAAAGAVCGNGVLGRGGCGDDELPRRDGLRA